MKKQFLKLLALSVALLGLSAFSAYGKKLPGPTINFKPLNSINVEGVAEIVDATPDGNTILYTNSEKKEIGIIDITDPQLPNIQSGIPVVGEPTSLSITPDGRYALATVWLNKPEEGQDPPDLNSHSALVVIDMQSKSKIGSIDIGFHPDSVKVTEINGRTVSVIAIENEPIILDEEGKVTDDDEPGNPNDFSDPGFIQVVYVDTQNPADSEVIDISLESVLRPEDGFLFVDDPQPEFVDIHGSTAAVSLQENNGIAVVDLANNPPVLSHVFSTGRVGDRPADLVEDNMISFGQLYPADVLGEEPLAGSRLPDAIAFSPNGKSILSADEGDMNFTGGRGWSLWSVDGTFCLDDAGHLEKQAVRFSHYPESRSENKGIEVEGVTTAVFGGHPLAFLVSERGSFMAVYSLRNKKHPKLLQILPTGVSPEGVKAIPQRKLVITADEKSGTLTVFKGIHRIYKAPVDQPCLASQPTANPEPWAAISGLAWQSPFHLVGVPDNAMPTAIYQIRIGIPSHFAPVRVLQQVTRNNEQAWYDGEGIAVDSSILAPHRPGWWIASEGNAKFGKEEYQPNLLVQIDGKGGVLREIKLPHHIDSSEGGLIRKNGFEGVAVSEDGNFLIAPIQRQFDGEPAEFTRIARLDLQTLTCEEDGEVQVCSGQWDFFFYPLDETDNSKSWIGLSEILAMGPNEYAVIERDKELGGKSKVKKIYAFSLDCLEDGDTIVKIQWVDILPLFSPYEKVEGLALTPSGDIWVGLDNDGGEVESRLVNIGQLPNPF